jgi:ferredoxin-NADP reductase
MPVTDASIPPATDAGIAPATEAGLGPQAASRLAWREAEIVEILVETPRAKSLVLRVPHWPGHLAGQHVDVKLTAEDGYQAERSYSIASPPERAELVLTVERIGDGEVSPFLTDEARPGDRLELRGPIGGYFTWAANDGGPLQLLAGGSGIVPLMCMLRHRAMAARVPARLLYSSRTGDAIIYRNELERLTYNDPQLGVVFTLTRETPPGWKGQSRRVDAEMLRRLTFSPAERPRIFVCGPTPFVESVATSLVGLGHPPARIKTERFGPTGG